MPTITWDPKSIKIASRNSVPTKYAKEYEQYHVGAKKAVVVPQKTSCVHDWVRNESDPEVTHLYTNGTATCVGVVIQGKDGASLGHLDSDAMKAGVEDVLRGMISKVPDVAEIYLVGSNMTKYVPSADSSAGTATSLSRAIVEAIEKADLGLPDHVGVYAAQGSGLLLDLETAQVLRINGTSADLPKSEEINPNLDQYGSDYFKFVESGKSLIEKNGKQWFENEKGDLILYDAPSDIEFTDQEAFAKIGRSIASASTSSASSSSTALGSQNDPGGTDPLNQGDDELGGSDNSLGAKDNLGGDSASSSESSADQSGSVDTGFDSGMGQQEPTQQEDAL